MNVFLNKIFSVACLTVIICSSCIACINSVTRQALKTSNSYSLNPYRQYYPSIVKVTLTPGTDGKSGWTATGWAIDEEHIITAGHFCQQHAIAMILKKAGEDIELTGSDNKGIHYHAGYGKVVKWEFTMDGKVDICIIKSEDHPLETLRLSDNFNIVEIEDPVTIIGAPDGNFPIRREGTVWGIDKRQIKITNHIVGGSSGSPVIWHGEVIGLVVRKGPEGLHLYAGEAVRGDILKKFYEDYLKLKKE